MDLAWVCGVDVGGINSLSFVAWLDTGTREFVLDHYVPGAGGSAPSLPPLPAIPAFHGGVDCYAFDCPQGLPKLGFGEKRRVCDRAADTPTRIMPLHGLNSYSGPYASLIQVGVRLFATAVSSGQAQLYGYPSSNVARPTICETYPRKILKDSFGFSSIPSKRNKPYAYVNDVWKKLQGLGYACRGVLRPTVDQVDAMLCAVAAEHLRKGQIRALGDPPIWDPQENLFREGYIVVPR